jgi:hypothetical protein
MGATLRSVKALPRKLSEYQINQSKRKFSQRAQRAN